MKTKLQLLTLTILLSAASLFAQPGNPAVVGMGFDPATPSPMPQALPDWKDPKWKDPDIILTNLSFDGLPIGQVAHYLSEQYKESFDVLLPANGNWGTDWNDLGIKLRLKNVAASEVFSAMNLLFENDRTPLRWELKVNGHRQIALLRVLADPNPPVATGPAIGALAPAPEPVRKIFFVGDLVGDEKSGGMTIKQIVTTIKEVWEMTDNAGGKIQFHESAQLVVVTGTGGQIDFVEQTLSGLRQKADLTRAPQSKPEESKLGGAGGLR